MTDVSIEGLSDTERAVWSAFGLGAWTDLRTGDPDADDLALARTWPQARVVRAEVVAALLLGAAGPQRGNAPALRLRGVRITGRLDLTGATVEHAFVCEYCVFDEEPCFVDAATKTLRIVESLLPSFDGTRLNARGIVDFAGSVISASLSLDRANVVGELRLSRAAVGSNPAVVAISAEGLSVDGLMQCTDGFTCTGSIMLRGVRITGSLELDDALLAADGLPALRADNATIGGRLKGEGLKVIGEVRLSNTRIAGWLNLNGADLRNPGDVALGGGGLSVDGAIWCGKSFVARGEVRLIGARVGGNVSLVGADLSHPGGDALNLDRAAVNDVDAERLRVADSRVTMRNAQCTGRVNLAAAQLDGGVGQTALVTDGATITGSFDLRGMHATGEVRLRTCSVSERLLLREVAIDNAPGIGLRLSRTRVGADVFCGGMTVKGIVKLSGLTVGNHAQLNEIAVSNPGDVAIDAEGLQAGTLTLFPRERIEGKVLLGSARLGRLRDDPDQWPDELVLDGLTYGDLEPARDRLRWLTRDPRGFQPQPYEQLAAYYKATGRYAEARRVQHAKERRQRDAKPLSGRIWGWLQDVTVAYGFQPRRALYWLLALLVAGSATYAASPPPALDSAHAPHFNPVVYTLDLLLPVVDLGQKHAFNPAGAEQWFSYGLIAAGWILVTTIAAGAARTLNRFQ